MTPWAEAMNARQAAGLCRLCGAPQVPGRALCERHLSEQTARRMRKYLAKKAKGKCVEQGRRRVPQAGQVRCPRCMERQRIYQANWRREQKQSEASADE